MNFKEDTRTLDYSSYAFIGILWGFCRVIHRVIWFWGFSGRGVE